jgi:hypothetical protein
MTPEVELQIRDQIWERMRHCLVDGYLAGHADFLEAQWEWCLSWGWSTMRRT